MSDKDTLVVLGASYDSVAEAEADYEAVKDLYYAAGSDTISTRPSSCAETMARSRSPTSTSSPHAMEPGPVSPSAR
jgi:hypothetical protein